MATLADRQKEQFRCVKKFAQYRGKNAQINETPGLDRSPRLHEDLKILKQQACAPEDTRKKSELWGEQASKFGPSWTTKPTKGEFMECVSRDPGEWGNTTSYRLCEGALLDDMSYHLNNLVITDELAVFKVAKFDQVCVQSKWTRKMPPVAISHRKIHVKIVFSYYGFNPYPSPDKNRIARFRTITPIKSPTKCSTKFHVLSMGDTFQTSAMESPSTMINPLTDDSSGSLSSLTKKVLAWTEGANMGGKPGLGQRQCTAGEIKRTVGSSVSIAVSQRGSAIHRKRSGSKKSGGSAHKPVIDTWGPEHSQQDLVSGGQGAAAEDGRESRQSHQGSADKTRRQSGIYARESTSRVFGSTSGMIRRGTIMAGSGSGSGGMARRKSSVMGMMIESSLGKGRQTSLTGVSPTEELDERGESPASCVEDGGPAPVGSDSLARRGIGLTDSVLSIIRRRSVFDGASGLEQQGTGVLVQRQGSGSKNSLSWQRGSWKALETIKRKSVDDGVSAAVPTSGSEIMVPESTRGRRGSMVPHINSAPADPSKRLSHGSAGGLNAGSSGVLGTAGGARDQSMSVFICTQDGAVLHNEEYIVDVDAPLHDVKEQDEEAAAKDEADKKKKQAEYTTIAPRVGISDAFDPFDKYDSIHSTIEFNMSEASENSKLPCQLRKSDIPFFSGADYWRSLCKERQSLLISWHLPRPTLTNPKENILMEDPDPASYRYSADPRRFATLRNFLKDKRLHRSATEPVVKGIHHVGFKGVVSDNTKSRSGGSAGNENDDAESDDCHSCGCLKYESQFEVELGKFVSKYDYNDPPFPISPMASKENMDSEPVLIKYYKSRPSPPPSLLRSSQLNKNASTDKLQRIKRRKTIRKKIPSPTASWMMLSAQLGTFLDESFLPKLEKINEGKKKKPRIRLKPKKNKKYEDLDLKPVIPQGILEQPVPIFNQPDISEREWKEWIMGRVKTIVVRKEQVTFAEGKWPTINSFTFSIPPVRFKNTP